MGPGVLVRGMLFQRGQNRFGRLRCALVATGSKSLPSSAIDVISDMPVAVTWSGISPTQLLETCKAHGVIASNKSVVAECL